MITERQKVAKHQRKQCVSGVWIFSAEFWALLRLCLSFRPSDEEPNLLDIYSAVLPCRKQWSGERLFSQLTDHFGHSVRVDRSSLKLHDADHPSVDVRWWNGAGLPLCFIAAFLITHRGSSGFPATAALRTHVLIAWAVLSTNGSSGVVMAGNCQHCAENN